MAGEVSIERGFEPTDPNGGHDIYKKSIILSTPG